MPEQGAEHLLLNWIKTGALFIALMWVAVLACAIAFVVFVMVDELLDRARFRRKVRGVEREAEEILREASRR